MLLRLPIWQILENCRLARTACLGQTLLEIGGKRCGNFRNVECSLSVADSGNKSQGLTCFVSSLETAKVYIIFQNSNVLVISRFQ